MKILYILGSAVMAGSTMSFLTLVKGVIAEGHIPYIVIPRRNYQIEDIFKSLGVTYFVVPVIEYSYPRAITNRQTWGYPFYCLKLVKQYKSNVFEIKNIVERESIDIIHTNVGPVNEGHAVSQITGIPHVWHIREYGDLDFGIRYFPSKKKFRSKLKKDYVIFITEALKKYNEFHLCDNAYVIYNGVKRKTETQYIINKEKYFLMASRVSPEKGHDEVIKCFAKFHKTHTNYKLLILGEGTDKYISHLKDLISANDISSFVIFLGFQNNVTEFMKKATALVVASPFEGFGRMTAEAIFSGAVVIGKNTSGTKEILERTGGFLYNSEQELVKSMNEVAALSLTDYKSIIINSQEIAKSLYTEESYVNKVLSVYLRAISNRKI